MNWKKDWQAGRPPYDFFLKKGLREKFGMVT